MKGKKEKLNPSHCLADRKAARGICPRMSSYFALQKQEKYPQNVKLHLASLYRAGLLGRSQVARMLQASEQQQEQNLPDLGTAL